MTTGKQTQTDSHSPDPSFPHQQTNKQILSTRLRHPDVRCTDLWFLFSWASWVGPSLTWCPGPPATSHVYSTLFDNAHRFRHSTSHVYNTLSGNAHHFRQPHFTCTTHCLTVLITSGTAHHTCTTHCLAMFNTSGTAHHTCTAHWQCSSLQAITFHVTHAHHFRQSQFTPKIYLSLKATVSHYEYLHFASSSNSVRQGVFFTL